MFEIPRSQDIKKKTKKNYQINIFLFIYLFFLKFIGNMSHSYKPHGSGLGTIGIILVVYIHIYIYIINTISNQQFGILKKLKTF